MNETTATASEAAAAAASEIQTEAAQAQTEAAQAQTEAAQAAAVTIPATQSRWRSWTMWASVAGALWVIVNAMGLPVKWGFSADTYNTILNAVGTALVALGIVNNPTDSVNL